jgi:hypothetical protein
MRNRLGSLLAFGGKGRKRSGLAGCKGEGCVGNEVWVFLGIGEGGRRVGVAGCRKCRFGIGDRSLGSRRD